MNEVTMLDTLEYELSKDEVMAEFIKNRLAKMPDDAIRKGIAALMVDTWKAAKESK